LPAMVGVLQAPPGTELYRRLEREGRIIDEGTATKGNSGGNVTKPVTLETGLVVDGEDRASREHCLALGFSHSYRLAKFLAEPVLLHLLGELQLIVKA